MTRNRKVPPWVSRKTSILGSILMARSTTTASCIEQATQGRDRTRPPTAHSRIASAGGFLKSEGRGLNLRDIHEPRAPLQVPNRTFSRESPSLYLPRRYKVYLQERDGSTDLAYSRSLPRGSWSRKRAHCRECGTQDRPHGGNGLCSRCFSRNWARGTPTVPYR